ncbi:MAG: hypothetical protein J6B87_07145 [Clostridia bacterium]|nr:hypothetical protein [Clostridia bacterium]
MKTRFKNIYKRTSRPDEKIILMKKGVSEHKNDLGFAKEKYIPIQELHGIIQGDQDLDIDESGQESHPGYIAYLMPEFNLERENLNDFRIKYERPYETMIMKIMSYDPNLFLRHKRHHITLILLLEKKYVE